MNRHIYTDSEKEFLKEFVSGHSHKEIRDAFEEKFGWPISLIQVKSSIKRYKLNTGRKGYFTKGQSSHNKGQKMSIDVYEKCKGTMFKKGRMPVNYRPVGSERINVDGYIEVKIKDPSTWKLKHIVVYEEQYGEIPKGHVVIFLNGNKLDTDISNLKMIKRSELLIMNRDGLISNNPEVTEVALNLARLIDRTNTTRRKVKKCQKIK